MPYDESDDYDVYEIIDQAYNEADRMSRPIHLLLETYQKYEEHDPDADRVADDRQALEWLDDYWEYVKWNEHGNESSIDEVGGFRGLARTVTDSDYVDSTLDYLIYEDDPNLIDPTARDLADRLKIIASRYGALRKMKKMSFTERVCQYIKNNYDIPEKMEFYIGTDGYDFEDWVDAYIEEYNNNVSSPYGNDSDESDVKVVAEEILQIMTAPYKMGNEYVINNDDFEASTKKMKKSKEFWEREDCFDELTPDMQDKVRDLCMTLQVNDPIIEKRDDGYYFLFSYYDGDPEYYFDKYDIQQDKEGKFNYFKLDKMKKSQDIHSMIADVRKNNNSLVKNRVDLNGIQRYGKKQRMGNGLLKKEKRIDYSVEVRDIKNRDADVWEWYDSKPSVSTIMKLCEEKNLFGLLLEPYSYDTIQLGEMEYPFMEVYQRMGLDKEWKKIFKESLQQAVDTAYNSMQPVEIIGDSYSNWTVLEDVEGVAEFEFPPLGTYLSVHIEKIVKVWND